MPRSKAHGRLHSQAVESNLPTKTSKEKHRAVKRARRDAKKSIVANPANDQNAGVVPGSRGNATADGSRKGKKKLAKSVLLVSFLTLVSVLCH